MRYHNQYWVKCFILFFLTSHHTLDLETKWNWDLNSGSPGIVQILKCRCRISGGYMFRSESHGFNLWDKPTGRISKCLPAASAIVAAIGASWTEWRPGMAGLAWRVRERRSSPQCWPDLRGMRRCWCVASQSLAVTSGLGSEPLVAGAICMNTGGNLY